MHSSHFISTSAQYRRSIIEVSKKCSNLLLYVYATRINLEITFQVFHDMAPLKDVTIHITIEVLGVLPPNVIHWVFFVLQAIYGLWPYRP